MRGWLDLRCHGDLHAWLPTGPTYPLTAHNLDYLDSVDQAALYVYLVQQEAG